MSKNKDIRVRIAPSPTGDPHVGTAYIALFNYVFAQKAGGRFVLRIEDTDQTRSKSSSEDMILESLRWLGLEWDEGPDKGGNFGPYRQSERLDIYKTHVDHLIAEEKAYPCFCSSDRLDEVRQAQKQEGKTPGYDRHCREIPQDEAKKRIDEGEVYVVRLKAPLSGVISYNDELRGDIEFDSKQIDDQVLLKSDGFPTYHLANVIDDHLMEITHVIRAEEWISSTPKHVLLYQAFGWEQPVWIHLSLLRNSDKSKISKRKNPVSLQYYKRAGFLPEALINFLALMGWSFGDDQEIFSLDQMIKVFDLKKFSLGGPVFDLDKLTWLNQIYMHKMSAAEFAGYLREHVFTQEYLELLQPLALERMSRFEQFVGNNDFFFNGQLDYSELPIIPKKLEKKDVRNMVKELVVLLDDLYEWEAEKIGEVLMQQKNLLGWKPKDYFMTVRYITTGRKDSPPLNESLELIGREMVRFRLRDFLKSPVMKN